MTAVEARVATGAPAHARPGPLVRRIAQAAVGVQILVVSWLCLKGWFYADDFMFRGQGARFPWFDPAYVFQPWGGHYMPLSFVVAQPFSKLGGFDYIWVALSLAAGQALIAVLMYRFLMRQFGARWRILLPLLLFLTSVPVLQISVWWATALNSTPYIACMIIAADHTLRLARTGRRWEYAWILGSTAVALGFFEKAVLLPVLVALLLVAVTPARTPIAAAWHLIRAHWILLAGFVAVLAGWFLMYRANGTDDVVRGLNLARLSDQLSTGLVGTFVPSLFGGPWAWAEAQSSYNAVPTPLWAGLVLSVLVLVGVLFAATLGPRARRALLMAAVYAALVLLLINLGRSQFLVETASLPRYYADLVVVVVLASALMLARLRDDPAPEMLTEWRPRRLRAASIAAIVVAQLQIASFIVAVTGFAPGLGDGPEARWTKSALASLKAMGTQSTFLDGAVPGYVVWALIYPYNTYSWFFAGEDVPRFTSSVDQLLLLDDAGRVVPGRVEGPASLPGPVDRCGYLVQDRWTTVTMASDIVRYDHLMHLAYISSVGTELEIRMGEDPTTTVALKKGLNDIYTAMLGGGRTVSLRATSPGASVCVSSVEIGTATSAPLPPPGS